MAAPTVVHAPFTALFTTVSSVELATTGNIAAGSSLCVGITQTQATRRTITGLTDDQTNTYATIGNEYGVSGAYLDTYSAAQIATGLTTGDTINLTFNNNSIGRFSAIAVSAATVGPSDTYVASSATSHACATTGFSTSADVYMIGWACLGGANGSVTAGDSYTRELVGDTRSLMFTKSSDSALGTQTAPYTITTSRAATGVLVAFYAVAAGRTTKNTRAWPLGVNVGMGWRMPA